MKPDPYQIEAVCRAIDRFESSLREDCSVQNMADAACYSLFHFCRVFASVTHLTPYQYMLRRRLAQAALDLQATDENISRIALDCCFNSPETFSRAFNRYFGMLPSRWRSDTPHPSSLIMPAFDYALLDLLHNDLTVIENPDPPPGRLYGIMNPGDFDDLERMLRMITGKDDPVWFVRWYPGELPGEWFSFVGFERSPETEGLASIDLPHGGWSAIEMQGGTLDLAEILLQHVVLADRVPVMPIEYAVKIQNRVMALNLNELTDSV